jgi:hypothetical protein
MRPRFRVVIGAIVLACPAFLTAGPQQPAPALQAPASKLPPARQVIDRHIEAIGGARLILGRTSSKATGTVEIATMGLKGTVEIFSAKPNKSLLRTELPGVGRIDRGYDGAVGWSINPMTGPMLLQGRELEQTAFDADFYGELRADSRYRSIETVEKAEFEGRPCYKLKLVRSNGEESFEFYDVASGLRAGMVRAQETEMGSMMVTSIETDYRRFGDLLVPTTLSQKVMGISQRVTLTSIEFDSVDPEVFALPQVIRALIK